MEKKIFCVFESIILFDNFFNAIQSRATRKLFFLKIYCFKYSSNIYDFDFNNRIYNEKKGILEIYLIRAIKKHDYLIYSRSFLDRLW